MDQAAPADQVVLWHLSERSEEPDMGRVVHLSTRGHREKAARYSMLPLHLVTNSGGQHIREKANHIACFRGS